MDAGNSRSHRTKDALEKLAADYGTFISVPLPIQNGYQAADSLSIVIKTTTWL